MNAIIFLPEAEQEMLEAAQYYQEQASGLGLDFLLEIERAVHSITQSPHTWPVLEGELRRRLIRRFPLGILYRIDPEAVVIVAVAHLRKQPGYWRKRIKQG